MLFSLEVYIALYVHDDIVRPYIGDMLVVILIYCLLKAFFQISFWKLATGVLLFSYLVECLQYIHFIERIGLQDSHLANIIIGNSFAWLDLLAYTAGFVLIVIVEVVFRKNGSEALCTT